MILTFLTFPWPVEVFLSDVHSPKYDVCNILAVYMTHRDAGYPDSESLSIFALDASIDILIWVFLKFP